MSKKIIIGSRGSKLALLYAQKARDKILKNTQFNDQDIIIKKITTKGDEFEDVRLSELGGKGLFSSNIEKELMNENVDIAVHALKDMPALGTEGLTTDAFLERNDPREILITPNKKKLKDGIYDAIILSYAGIKFLEFDSEISEIFSPEKIIPSAGQGIIALQCREQDEKIISILKNINHNETFMRAHSERNVLKVLEGDCETAVGAYSNIEGNKITLEAELFSLDGSERFYEKKTGRVEDYSEIGKEVGEILKSKSNNSYKR